LGEKIGGKLGARFLREKVWEKFAEKTGVKILGKSFLGEIVGGISGKFFWGGRCGQVFLG